MTTVAWPTTRPFAPQRCTIGVDVRERAFVGFYSGNRTRLSTLAERMRATLTLGICLPSEAGAREALILGHLISLGGRVTFGAFHRQHPLGSISGSGTITVAAATAAGSRSVTLASMTAGSTLAAGDYIAIGGNLLQVGYAGAVASGGGSATVPLMFPLPAAVAAGAAVSWAAPTGAWELDADTLQIDYVAPRMQLPLVLPFRQVVV